MPSRSRRLIPGGLLGRNRVATSAAASAGNTDKVKAAFYVDFIVNELKGKLKATRDEYKKKEKDGSSASVLFGIRTKFRNLVLTWPHYSFPEFEEQVSPNEAGDYPDKSMPFPSDKIIKHINYGQRLKIAKTALLAYRKAEDTRVRLQGLEPYAALNGTGGFKAFISLYIHPRIRNAMPAEEENEEGADSDYDAAQFDSRERMRIPGQMPYGHTPPTAYRDIAPAYNLPTYSDAQAGGRKTRSKRGRKTRKGRRRKTRRY